MMLEIPLKPKMSQHIVVTLDGQECDLLLYQRSGTSAPPMLYLDLKVDQKQVFVGNICTHRINLLQSPTTLFSGSLHFIDKFGTSSPTFKGLGTRYFLVYCRQGETLPEK